VRRTLLTAAGVLVALATFAVVRSARVAPPAQAAAPLQTPDHAPVEAQRGAVATRTTSGGAAAPDRSTLLELPDGTRVRALNGAVDAPPMGDFWGPFAWSPIVAIERSDAGLDWYRHADGSYSTTQMVMRADLGREVAMTRVAHPGPRPAATAPGR